MTEFFQDQGAYPDPNNNNNNDMNQHITASEQIKKKSLISLTIKQIHNCVADQNRPDKITFAGHEIDKVNFVGYIMEVDEKPEKSMASYLIDDSTGCIWVRSWLESNDEQKNAFSEFIKTRQEMFKQGRMYVRVIGTVKEFNSKKSIQSTRIQAVTDPNEINYHYLECLHTYLLLQRGFSNPSSDFQTSNILSNGTSNQIHQSILELVQGNSSDDGCSRQFIASTLNISPAEIKDHLAFLTDEGYLYTTIDEDHFHCTN